MHDSLDIVINDLKGSTGLIIHHIVVRISSHSTFLVCDDNITQLLLFSFNQPHLCRECYNNVISFIVSF